ncbi:MAG: cytochrome C, partial [Acidobacteriota bacterium]
TGPLVRYDDFLVTLQQSDGTVRTIRRNGAVPKVEITDPMEFHRGLPAVLNDKDMHDVTAYLATLK